MGTQVARGVEQEQRRDADEADEQAGDGGTDDARPVEGGAVERDRRRRRPSRPTISTTNDCRMGMSKALTMPSRKAMHHDLPDLRHGPAARAVPRTRARHIAATWVHEQAQALGQGVGGEAAEQAQDHHRQELGGRHEAQRDRVVGQLEHQPVLGHGLHPGAGRARPAGPR